MEDNVKKKNQRLRVTLLGTGTSGGVPSLGCRTSVSSLCRYLSSPSMLFS